MRKTLMAVAVAGALTAPAGVAMAQTSTVNVFGTIHVIYNRQSSYSTSATESRPNVDHLTQSDSELGFRGEEQLGGGLSAWFQCASSFDMVGTGGAEGSAAWCGRNSAIGIKGGFGNVFFGIWDTPEKLMIGPIRGWFGFANILGGVGNTLENGSQSGVNNPSPIGVSTGANATTAITAGNAGWARRQTRLVNYHSPSFGGFAFMGAYSVANEATDTLSGQAANKARLWSAAASYSSGPIYAAVSYERHHNYNPANRPPIAAVGSTPASNVIVPAQTGPTVLTATGVAVVPATQVTHPAQTVPVNFSTAGGAGGVGGTAANGYNGGNDHKWGIGGAYTFAGVAKLSGIYNWFKYDTSNTTEFKARTWAVFLDWTIAGPHSLKAAFTRLNDTKSNHGAGTTSGTRVGLWTANGGAGNTSAKQYNLAYAYGFSKRTTGYIAWAHIDNDSNSQIALPGGPGGQPRVGENETAYGIGIRHSF